MSDALNGESPKAGKKSHLPAGMRPAAMTEPEAAEYLAISPRKLWELAAGGEVPCLRIGKAKRYRTVDLDAYLAKLAGCGK